MIDARDMAARNAALTQLLAEKHGGRARSLAAAVRRAGRRLPKSARAQAAVLIEAERLATIPKLARRIDEAAVKRADKELTAHLSAIDVTERRKSFWLGLAGVIAAQVLVVATAFVVWMWWRGYV
jgi:hypothetical protein